MTFAAKAAVGWLFLVCCCAQCQSMVAAQAAAKAGKVDAAISALASTPKSAEAESLLCSLHASIDERDAAVSACEAAAAAGPTNSNYALELARAYGEKADHSGAITGMRMVGRVRTNFERAVQLDGQSVEALSDLGQFYVEAPGIVGGGLDKARGVAAKLQPLSPARAHRLLAMIAAKDGKDSVAVAEYQAELSVSHSAEAYVDLANFYKSRKQPEPAAKMAEQALEHDTHHGPDTLDAARVLLSLHRNESTAQDALRSYLKSPQVGVAQFARAHVLLGQSLQASGDNAGAQTEVQAALSLARNYEAAKRGAAR